MVAFDIFFGSLLGALRDPWPLDAIPESDEPDDSPAFLRRKHSYQSLVGSIGLVEQRAHRTLTSRRQHPCQSLTKKQAKPKRR